ncbi:MAG TPA: T9SS type A sorting domain-containing protein, partial [Cytophagaceae bacterium]|nr:T9SS type A sorting domain-containing protein [Cytophagaceae bacterium]
INNDHFVIEKSNDGKIFDYLTSVAGHGNSNVVLNYSYTDSSPLAGLNYYCLKQYDYNGVEHTLGYIVISSLDGKENGIEKIYPNPFSNELIIQTSEVLDKSKTSVRVINLLGAEMTSVTSLFEGQNIRLNAAVMDKGIYYLQLVYEDKIEIRKIIKE